MTGIGRQFVQKSKNLNEKKKQMIGFQLFPDSNADSLTKDSGGRLTSLSYTVTERMNRVFLENVSYFPFYFSYNFLSRGRSVRCCQGAS